MARQNERHNSNLNPDIVIRVANKRSYVSVIILFLLNLVNYMDRYTIAAVLRDIQGYFQINDQKGGLLQTIFFLIYLLFAPVFGYLGDRYTRKFIMAFGVIIWSTTVLGSTFVRKQDFWIFLALRGVIGIGEASYATIAPTIIADLFARNLRSKMLMIFYFAIPVGSGLGYVIGRSLADAFNQWQWGLRLTPIFGYILTILILFVIPEPMRGQSEIVTDFEETDFKSDIFKILQTKTFVLVSIANICVYFISGSVSFWLPNFASFAKKAAIYPADVTNIDFICGAVMCLSGFAGVAIGSISSQIWRKSNPKADAYVCAIGMLICGPMAYITVNVIYQNINAGFTAAFFAMTGLCLNWSLTQDIMMYVVIPTRRSTANALALTISHLFGDAPSPYIVGAISDAVRGSSNNSYAHYQSLMYALYIVAFVSIVGGLFFLLSAIFLVKDKLQADQDMQLAAQQKISSITFPKEQNMISNGINLTASNSHLQVTDGLAFETEQRF